GKHHHLFQRVLRSDVKKGAPAVEPADWKGEPPTVGRGPGGIKACEQSATLGRLGGRKVLPKENRAVRTDEAAVLRTSPIRVREYDVVVDELGRRAAWALW